MSGVCLRVGLSVGVWLWMCTHFCTQCMYMCVAGILVCVCCWVWLHVCAQGQSHYKCSELPQVVEDGYEFFARRQLVTLFSAPNYCGDYDNAGGMMTVDENLLCSFQVSRCCIYRPIVYFLLPPPSSPYSSPTPPPLFCILHITSLHPHSPYHLPLSTLSILLLVWHNQTLAWGGSG